MKRRAGLGRGLDALLPQDEVIRLEGRSGLQEVAVDAIVPNPRQPRSNFDEGAIEELAASIRTLGVLQPLLVRLLSDGRLELVAGERRWRAAQRAGLERVPVLAVDTDERGSLERALVENLHRENLNPIEEAEGYKALLEESGGTQDALANRLGRSRAAVTNALRLLELPDPIKKLLVDGRLGAAHGRALLVLTRNPFQKRLATRVAQEGLSVRETEELVRRYEGMTGASAGSRERSERPAAISEAERLLARHLQARVRVDMTKRKGKIVIDFASLEELDRLLRVITGEEPGGSASAAAPGASPQPSS